MNQGQICATISESLTHDDLVRIGRRWLFRNCPVVVTELASCGEEPDCIGWRSGISTLIECKATRSDFLSDKKKEFRVNPSRGVGSFRYFLTPDNLITVDELPEGWGLLVTNGKRVRKLKESSNFVVVNHLHEKVMLLSLVRRLANSPHPGVSINKYIYSTQNRASVCVEIEE